MFFNNLKLTPKLIITGLILTGIPLLIVAIITINQNNHMMETASDESLKMAYQDMDHITEGVYSMCHAQQELLQKYVNSSLNVARNVLKNYGKIQVSQESSNWTITNQYTKKTTTLSVPKIKIGDIYLNKNDSQDVESVVVDDVKHLVNATCTVFQKINDQGDMLRISTNVMKKNGKRAVGTFIPSINPDGKRNPVVETLLKKETFRGRAYVVNQWYITAYEPILDQNKNVIGALYVGVPQESVVSLRNAILNTKIGEKGYVFVIDSKGNYVISQGGKRDGENIWNLKDSNGNYFVQEMSKKALTLDDTSIGEHTYPWGNTGSDPKQKIAKFKYFKAWDWIIGSGTNVEELYSTKNKLEAIGKKGNVKLGLIFIGTLTTSFICWLFISNGIVRPIKKGIDFAIKMSSGDFSQYLDIKKKDETGILAKALNTMTKKLNDSFHDVTSGVVILDSASNQLVGMSDELAIELKEASESSLNVTSKASDMTENMNSVAASMEQASKNVSQISISSKEMTVTINEIVKSSAEAGNIADSAVSKFQIVTETIENLDGVTQSINEVTGKIAEISEQTNLLALNATIEAARAGEAGRGFAVVAGEIKELSALTAKATQEINEKVNDIQNSTGTTIEEIKSASIVIDDVREIITSIVAAMEEQSVTTNEISQNVDEAALGISDTSENVSQASVLVQDVAKDINQINNSFKMISDRSGKLNNNADELILLSNNLGESVGKFTLE